MDEIKISISQNGKGGGTIKIEGDQINLNYKAEYLMLHIIKSTQDSPFFGCITSIEAKGLSPE